MPRFPPRRATRSWTISQHVFRQCLCPRPALETMLEFLDSWSWHFMWVNLLCLLLILTTLLWVKVISFCLLAFVVEGLGWRGGILAGYPCFVSSSWWAGAVWCPTDLESYCTAVSWHFWFSWSTGGTSLVILMTENLILRITSTIMSSIVS